MPYTYDFDPRGFVRIRHDGPFDMVEWEKTMRAIACDARHRPGMPILFDDRGCTVLPPPGESRRVSDGWARLAPGSPVAIVATVGTAVYGVARQVSAQSNGQAEVFSEETEAEAWLLTPREPARSNNH